MARNKRLNCRFTDGEHMNQENSSANCMYITCSKNPYYQEFLIKESDKKIRFIQ